MNRFYTILGVLFLILGVGVFLFFYYPALTTPPFEISTVSYDVDADGNVDLVRWDFNGELGLWEWDRNGDGQPELIAYETPSAPGQSGSISAWDWGGDAIIDSGAVTPTQEAMLQREDIVAARTAGAGDNVALVGADIRDLVDDIERQFNDFRLADLRMPIVGSHLPALNNLLPGAPRAYRNGIHQGFDMYNGQIGVPTAYSGPVVASKDGTVVRATLDFVEMTVDEHTAAIAASQAAGTTPPDVLDRFRGRQVWIDHGHGVVTRYVHLSGIAADITEGKNVRAGDIIGFVGNSGTEAGVNGTRGSAHLHFEVRIDDRYFGEGMSYDDIRAVANRLFGLDAQ